MTDLFPLKMSFDKFLIKRKKKKVVFSKKSENS